MSHPLHVVSSQIERNRGVIGAKGVGMQKLWPPAMSRHCRSDACQLGRNRVHKQIMNHLWMISLWKFSNGQPPLSAVTLTKVCVYVCVKLRERGKLRVDGMGQWMVHMCSSSAHLVRWITSKWWYAWLAGGLTVSVRVRKQLYKRKFDVSCSYSRLSLDNTKKRKF